MASQHRAASPHLNHLATADAALGWMPSRFGTGVRSGAFLFVDKAFSLAADPGWPSSAPSRRRMPALGKVRT